MDTSSLPARPMKFATTRRSGKPILARRCIDAGGQGSSRLLRQESHPSGCRPAYCRRRGGKPAWAQRCRPLHHREGNHGRSAAAREYPVQRPGHCRPAKLQNCPLRTGLCAGTPRYLPRPYGAPEPSARHQGYPSSRHTEAGVVSGGEKQMLTICRTLMGDPELIMIDEPTEGLAPLIVQQVGDLIARIAEAGVAILLVEQKLSIALRISHRVYVMGHGRIVFEGTPDELKANAAVRKEWLEV